jgi:hypothetical protein
MRRERPARLTARAITSSPAGSIRTTLKGRSSVIAVARLAIPHMVVARLFVFNNATQVAHVEPPSATWTLQQVLALISRIAAQATHITHDTPRRFMPAEPARFRRYRCPHLNLAQPELHSLVVVESARWSGVRLGVLRSQRSSTCGIIPRLCVRERSAGQAVALAGASSSRRWRRFTLRADAHQSD